MSRGDNFSPQGYLSQESERNAYRPKTVVQRTGSIYSQHDPVGGGGFTLGRASVLGEVAPLEQLSGW